MRKIKQVDRPFLVYRTMPTGRMLYSAFESLDTAIAQTAKLPRRQLPATIWRRGYHDAPVYSRA